MVIRNQKGVSIVDALFAMVIASMIAAAITTSLGTWFNVRNQTANQDAANQYAQGIIAKTASVEWSKLGFVKPVEDSSVNLIGDTCKTGWRDQATIGGESFETVKLDSGTNPNGIAQTAVAEVRGKKYCVVTDVTWKTRPSSPAAGSYSSGIKNVSVVVSWEDKGVPRSIAVNSTRSPNIGEAIPSGLSEVKESEVSPIKSFSITKAYHDGVVGKICYIADWNDTTDTVKVIGSVSKSLSPAYLSVVLASTDRGTEKCTDVPEEVIYGYYGIEVSDEAGRKFIGTAEYQFPGSKLSRENLNLSWTAYPVAGATTYKVYKANNAEFSSGVLIATTTNTSYTLSEEVSAETWFRVDTENEKYSQTATSNVLHATATPTTTPTPTPTPTPTVTPTPTTTETPAPSGPSIVSAADIVAYDSNGALWNYGSTTATSATRKAIGPAGATIPSELFVTDWNSDGTFDLIVKEADGRLIFRKGLPTGGFTDTQIGNGWGGYAISVGKWKKNDAYPSIIGKDGALGDLYHYGNASGNALTPRVKIGTGWLLYDINLADWDKDGSMDILARGTLVNDMTLYRTDGAGAFITEVRPIIGTGWNFNHIRSLNERKGVGTVGLAARDSSGNLYYYPINKSAWGARELISTGWSTYRIAGN